MVGDHKQFPVAESVPTGSHAQQDIVLVYATFPTLEEAERVGGALVERGMAACVNILPGMTSIYVWQGERHRDRETVMLIKTRAELADAVVSATRELHPYDNPALVVLPVVGGSADFRRWVIEQTAAPRS
jgi:periplasmic divalent cation tolerance protein